MRLSPQSNQFVKVLRGYIQNPPHIGAFGSAWPHGIISGSQRNFVYNPSAKFENHLGLRIEAVYVAGLMVLWIGDKSNSIEPERAHAPSIQRDRPSKKPIPLLASFSCATPAARPP